MEITAVTTGGGATSGNTIATASFSIAADEVAYIGVWSYNIFDPPHPTITGWVEQGSVSYNTSTPIRLTVLRRVGAFSGAQTLTFSGEQNYVHWDVVKVTEAALADPDIQVKTAKHDGPATTVTATFDNALASSSFVLVFAGEWDLTTISPEAGYTNVYHNPDGNIGTCATIKRENAGDASPSVTTSGNTSIGLVAIEIALAGPTNYPEALSETVTNSESLAAVVAMAAALAETITDAEALAASVGIAPALEETLSDAEDLAAAAGVVAALDETVDADEALEALTAAVVALDETVELVEQLDVEATSAGATHYTAGLAETVAWTEALAAEQRARRRGRRQIPIDRPYKPVHYEVDLAEVVYISEAITGSGAHLVGLGEQVQYAESLATGTTCDVALAESMQLGESLDHSSHVTRFVDRIPEPALLEATAWAESLAVTFGRSTPPVAAKLARWLSGWLDEAP